MAFPLMALLPLLTEVPGAISKVAKLFGKNNVAETASMVDDIVKGNQSATPEQEQILTQVADEYRVQLEQIAVNKFIAQQQEDTKRIQSDNEVHIKRLDSDDQYVSRTRPKQIRQLFWLLFFQILTVNPIVLSFIVRFSTKTEGDKVIQLFDPKILTDNNGMASDALLYTAYIYATCMIGYTAVRSMFDKKDKPMGNPIKNIFKKF